MTRGQSWRLAPGGGLADGGLDAEGRVAELADQVRERAASPRVIPFLQAGMAQPQEVLIGPFAGLAPMSLEQIDGSVVVGHLVSGHGLVEEGLGQAGGIGKLPREFGESGLGLLPERAVKLVQAELNAPVSPGTSAASERSGGQQQGHQQNPSAQNGHSGMILNR